MIFMHFYITAFFHLFIVLGNGKLASFWDIRGSGNRGLGASGNQDIRDLIPRYSDVLVPDNPLP
jgi:hypothetical protein